MSNIYRFDRKNKEKYNNPTSERMLEAILNYNIEHRRAFLESVKKINKDILDSIDFLNVTPSTDVHYQHFLNIVEHEVYELKMYMEKLRRKYEKLD